MDYSVIKSICSEHKAEYFENQTLAEYTSFKIGGSCPLLIKPNSTKCACDLISAFAKNNISYKVMGKGSNLLISDKGVNCPIVLISPEIGTLTVLDDVIVCQAGLSLVSLCNKAAESGLSGLEFAYGIPGSVGGAVYMNAGAYGGEMKDIIESCSYIDECGKAHKIKKADMDLSYRHSFFSGKPYIITDVALRLKKDDREAIEQRMRENMRKRREKQPLEYPSAGSTFKRPEGDFAGRLIEAAGLKGYRLGGAQVSEKHCGFVINRDNADFNDVVGIIDVIKSKVRETSGKNLECEIIIWE